MFFTFMSLSGMTPAYLATAFCQPRDTVSPYRPTASTDYRDRWFATTGPNRLPDSSSIFFLLSCIWTRWFVFYFIVLHDFFVLFYCLSWRINFII